MPSTLHSERLVLDEPGERDIDALARCCSDPEVLRWIPLPAPFERVHAEYLVRTFVPNGKEHGTRAEWALRLTPDAALIGMVELLFQPAKSAELGFWIASEYRGRGLMTEALGAVIDHAFDPAGRGLVRLHWEAMIGNDASACVARRCGFHFEGTARGGIVFRGARRDAWQASLLRTDSRLPSTGWPCVTSLQHPDYERD